MRLQLPDSLHLAAPAYAVLTRRLRTRLRGAATKNRAKLGLMWHPTTALLTELFAVTPGKYVLPLLFLRGPCADAYAHRLSLTRLDVEILAVLRELTPSLRMLMRTVRGNWAPSC